MGVSTATACDRDGTLLCKTCYGKNFGPQGFGFAGGGAMMHTGVPTPDAPDQQQHQQGLAATAATTNASSSSAEPVASVTGVFEKMAVDATSQSSPSPRKDSTKPRPVFGGGASKCPKCGKSVYAAEQVGHSLPKKQCS